MGYRPNGPTGRTRWRKRLFSEPIFEREYVVNGISQVWRRAFPNEVELAVQALLSRLDDAAGWDAVNAIFEALFPYLMGTGPATSVGKSQSPSSWKREIKVGLAMALKRLADGDHQSREVR
jgi:hypothetical protein